MSIPNQYALQTKAAKGDVEAMRLLAEMAFVLADLQGDMIALFECLTFRRLAYARSGEQEDAFKLFYALAKAKALVADEDAQSAWDAEVIALTSRLADEGNQEAEESLNSMIESATEDTAATAKEIVALMKEGETN